MSLDLTKRLVIAIASSALFDLTESDGVFKEKGILAYKRYQERNISKILDKGVAFPFIKRLLKLNDVFPDIKPVEIILLSKNSYETGLRVFNSIEHYKLDISRAVFTGGYSNFKYLPAFSTSLFLSADEKDVKNAIDDGYAAGQVLNKNVVNDDESAELRICFDFDGVLADDTSEKIYKTKGMNDYKEHEKIHAVEPLNQGPLADLLKKISLLQKMERKKFEEDSNYKPILRTSIVTARDAPAHKRMITTLKSWKVNVDEAFFLGGIDKSCVLNVMKPHIFFDDQKIHLKNIDVPAVHIPFGIANKLSEDKSIESEENE